MGNHLRLCRNCNSAELQDLGFIGRIAPFFLKRVFRIELRVPISPHPVKQLIRKLGQPARKIFSKIYSSEAFLEMQICLACSFVQAKHPFPEEWITRLYVDYRSESYNLERIRYEPGYKLLAGRVGTDPKEMANRIQAATEFLSGKFETGEAFTMLDYGGADGRFLPNLPAKKFVYEISDIAPVTGVTRIADEGELGRYSYVHLAHVLEHVVQPLGLVTHVASFLEPGGYLYVEVPQEISNDNLARFREGKPTIELTVHEHINAYCIAAVTKLFEAAGLEIIAIEADQVDIGWIKGTHVRALGRKA